MPPAEFMRRRDFALDYCDKTAMRNYILNTSIHDIITL
mgnify:CR=1 FL=1